MLTKESYDRPELSFNKVLRPLAGELNNIVLVVCSSTCNTHLNTTVGQVHHLMANGVAPSSRTMRLSTLQTVVRPMAALPTIKITVISQPQPCNIAADRISHTPIFNFCH